MKPQKEYVIGSFESGIPKFYMKKGNHEDTTIRICRAATFKDTETAQLHLARLKKSDIMWAGFAVFSAEINILLTEI
jgi:hypothetical protein